MIENLRGKTVLLVEAPPELHAIFHAEFAARGASCVDANVRDLHPLLERLHHEGRRIDVLIAGADSAHRPDADLADFDPDSIGRAASRAAAPMFSAIKAVRDVLSHVPRYHIVLSAMEPERFTPGSGLRAAGEAALQTLCQYTHQRLTGDGSRINVLRYWLATAGRDGAQGAEVARAAVALCSGWMDSMGGQVVTVDRGAGFRDNAFRESAGNSDGPA